MTERRNRLQLDTGAEVPASVRADLVAEVRKRLEEGELDSELALVETALALLDGDAKSRNVSAG